MTITTSPSNNLPNELNTRIAQELLRQASYSFNLALVMIGVTALINCIGVGLLLSNHQSVGAVTTAIGLISTVPCRRFAKDANDRLTKALAEVKASPHQNGKIVR